MSHTNTEGNANNFTLTAISSFVVVFIFLVLFSRCHGDYHPGHAGEHHSTPAVEKAH